MYGKTLLAGPVRPFGSVLRACLFGVLLLSLAGCAQKPVGPPPADYAQDALRLHFDASPDLNAFSGRAHALVMCVYQLSNPQAFEDKLQEPSGPNRLLACGRFDPSVTARKRVIVQPGTTKDVVLDRVQGTRYVGIIAGYYQRRNNDYYKVVAIPVKMKSAGFFKKRAFLDVLELDISLEDKGMK